MTSSPLKKVCHCFAEAVLLGFSGKNTASAKQWHTSLGNGALFNGSVAPRFKPPYRRLLNGLPVDRGKFSLDESLRAE